jgi:hypothetical protein
LAPTEKCASAGCDGQNHSFEGARFLALLSMVAEFFGCYHGIVPLRYYGALALAVKYGIGGQQLALDAGPISSRRSRLSGRLSENSLNVTPITTS